MSPSEQEKMKRFYDAVGERYPEEEEVYRTLRGQLRCNFVRQWLENCSGSLLEIGTNRAMYLNMYNGGTRYGVDLSLPALKQAHREKPVFLAVADAERLQCLQPNSMQNVLCSEVIEHCLNPQRVFDSIAHVLAPNGRALLTTPNYKKKRPTWMNLGVMQEYGVESEWDTGYFHTAFRPDELEEMARNAGLDVVDAGTLEKEIKYVAKIPALILLTGRFFNKFFRSQKFARGNDHFFNSSQIFIYRLLSIFGLHRILRTFVNQGVRSFIKLTKI